MITRVKQSGFDDEVQAFRLERIAFQREDHPIPLGAGPKMMLHMVPKSGLGTDMVDLAAANLETDGPSPISAGGWNRRFNFDGFCLIDADSHERCSYVQIFHDGCIEAATNRFFYPYNDNVFIPIIEWEKELIERVHEYLKLQDRLGVLFPIAVMLSLVDVKGLTIMTEGSYPRCAGKPVDRKILLFPKVEVNSPGGDMKEQIRPMFDRLWNSVGYARSLNYDRDAKAKAQ